MPHFNIIKESVPKSSFRVQSVIGTYDLQSDSVRECFEGDIELPKDWNIGLIVGRSGTGKSTIAKELFGENIIDNYEYSHDNILDDMPKNASVSDICKTFNCVGFSSVPSWLKPYSVLSNGEKMRCDLARAILSDNDMFVFDEFTSVVDRNVAKIASYAMQKAIRKKNKQFIAVTCHYDVQDWLMPDWVFNTDDMSFQLIDAETQKKNRPTIKLDFYETKEKKYYWKLFGKYHYLNHSFNEAARVFLCSCNGELAGFCATLPFPHPRKKNTWKLHRTIIFPDYQGIGLGTMLSDFVAHKLKENGKCCITTLSNPALIFSRKKNKNWICTRIGRMGTGSEKGLIQNKHIKGSSSAQRITASFEYIGI